MALNLSLITHFFVRI